VSLLFQVIRSSTLRLDILGRVQSRWVNFSHVSICMLDVADNITQFDKYVRNELRFQPVDATLDGKPLYWLTSCVACR